MSGGNETITMTKDELRSLIKETVAETLTTFGMQADNPIEMQKDFQHLRDVRQSVEAVKRKGILVAVGIICSAFIAAGWVGLKLFIKS